MIYRNGYFWLCIWLSKRNVCLLYTSKTMLGGRIVSRNNKSDEEKLSTPCFFETSWGSNVMTFSIKVNNLSANHNDIIMFCWKIVYFNAESRIKSWSDSTKAEDIFGKNIDMYPFVIDKKTSKNSLQANFYANFISQVWTTSR